MFGVARHGEVGFGGSGEQWPGLSGLARRAADGLPPEYQEESNERETLEAASS
jgi:hypothetical protein